MLRIPWEKFKDLVPKEDEDIAFNGLHKGTIAFALEGYFLIEWENKGWGETTRLMLRTRRLRNPVTIGP